MVVEVRRVGSILIACTLTLASLLASCFSVGAHWGYQQPLAIIGSHLDK